jgi:hypothetical protein
MSFHALDACNNRESVINKDDKNERKISPMTRSDIFIRLAIEDAPSTRKSAPLMSKMNPMIKNK